MLNRIGIISDTHDNVEKIEKAIHYFNEVDVDLVIHAGDIVSPFIAAKFNNLNMDFVAIYGNNDGDKLGLRKTLKYRIFEDPHNFKIRGKEFFITHRERLIDSLEKSEDYDVIIYGHTHKADVRKTDKTIVINPGEACGYMYGESTIAVLNLDKREVDIVEV